MYFFYLLVLASLFCLSGARLWALLVAGSNTFENYRHQSNLCHVYQIIHKHGIPDQNVVTMFYDDMAYNRWNPYKGQLYNRPGGPNNYRNVPKDYTGKAVTPENFLNVLSGNKAAMHGIGSGRVIESNRNDRVFVYYTDHGGSGILAFPYSVLTRYALNQTLAKMYRAKRYNKMVLYIEACLSGSMFKNVLEHQPERLRIYVMTSSNTTAYTHLCYPNKTLGWMSDEFTAAWGQDSDNKDLHKATLETQFRITKKRVKLSPVQQFGRLDYSSMPLSMFQGDKNVRPLHYPKEPCHSVDTVSQTDLPLFLLEQNILEFKDNPMKQLVFQKELESESKAGVL